MQDDAANELDIIGNNAPWCLVAADLPAFAHQVFAGEFYESKGFGEQVIQSFAFLYSFFKFFGFGGNVCGIEILFVFGVELVDFGNEGTDFFDSFFVGIAEYFIEELIDHNFGLRLACVR